MKMAPSVMIDNVSDFSPIATKAPSSFNSRTLLLAPPSISSHEENLRNAMASHDRAVTDLQMLDRLSAGLVTLPDSTYDLILILTDADGTRTESSQLLDRDVFGRIAQALKAGGKLQAQDGTFVQDAAESELQEGILAGLMVEGNGLTKPDYGASETVPLRLRRKEKNGTVSSAGPPVATTVVQLNGKRKSVEMTKTRPAGVGFVDFSDDFGDPMITGEDDDDELIDEDTLLTEEDLKRPVNVRKSHALCRLMICCTNHSQLRNVLRGWASVVERARTAPVALLRRLPLKMQPSGRLLMLSSRPSSWVRMTLLRLTSLFKARLVLAEIAA